MSRQNEAFIGFVPASAEKRTKTSHNSSPSVDPLNNLGGVVNGSGRGTPKSFPGSLHLLQWKLSYQIFSYTPDISVAVKLHSVNCQLYRHRSIISTNVYDEFYGRVQNSLLTLR